MQRRTLEITAFFLPSVILSVALAGTNAFWGEPSMKEYTVVENPRATDLLAQIGPPLPAHMSAFFTGAVQEDLPVDPAVFRHDAKVALELIAQTGTVAFSDPFVQQVFSQSGAVLTRVLSISVYSTKRYRLLAGLYGHDNAAAYNMYLLDTYAKMGVERSRGRSAEPALNALMVAASRRGSIVGLEGPIMYYLDSITLEPALSSGRVNDVRSMLNSFLAAAGASTFRSIAPTSPQAILRFPYAIPLGRDFSSIIAMLRPDFLSVFTAATLDGLLMGMPGIGGYEGFADFLSTSDCNAIPNVSEPSGGWPEGDATKGVALSESVFQSCSASGGGAGGDNDAEPSDGGGIGRAIGGAMAGSCTNITQSTLDVINPVGAETQLITSMVESAHRCYQDSLIGGAGCAICSGGWTLREALITIGTDAMVAGTVVTAVSGGAAAKLGVGLIVAGAILYYAGRMVEPLEEQQAEGDNPNEVPAEDADEGVEDSEDQSIASTSSTSGSGGGNVASGPDGPGGSPESCEAFQDAAEKVIDGWGEDFVSYPDPEGVDFLAGDCMARRGTMLTACEDAMNNSPEDCPYPDGCCGTSPLDEMVAGLYSIAECASTNCPDGTTPTGTEAGCSCEMLGESSVSVGEANLSLPRIPANPLRVLEPEVLWLSFGEDAVTDEAIAMPGNDDARMMMFRHRRDFSNLTQGN